MKKFIFILLSLFLSLPVFADQSASDKVIAESKERANQHKEKYEELSKAYLDYLDKNGLSDAKESDLTEEQKAIVKGFEDDIDTEGQKLLAEKDKQNAELDKQNAELDKQNAELDKQNAEKEKIIIQLDKNYEKIKGINSSLKEN